MNKATFPCNCKHDNRFGFIKKLSCFAILVSLSLTLMYNFQIIPALIPFAKAKATTSITYELQKVIGTCVSSGDYSDFVTLNYNNNGEVVSLETNAANIALLTSDITEKAIDTISQNDRMTVSIPVGNLTGGAIFTGKGPAIEIKIAVSKKVNCRIENEFYESGINQTLHRIVAVVDTEVYALVPMSTQTMNVTTEYCVAETVIVGDVPDAYTKINRLDDELSESDIDDIYDFGATLK